MTADFRLIETMRVLEDAELFLLDRHLHRLRQSARHFSFKHDSEKIRDAIREAAPRRRASLRLLLAEDGEVEISPGPIPAGNAERLKIPDVRVNSNDPFLYHKTTKREIYDQARRECPEGADALLVNERGEITETTITNVAFFRDGIWVTPALSCGLLPGVLRAELLSRGEIVEGIIHPDDLNSSDPIRCFNALRGMFEAYLL